MKNLELKPGDLCDCLSFLEYSFVHKLLVPVLHMEVDLSEPCYCLILKNEHPNYFVLFKGDIAKVIILEKTDVEKVFKKVK